MQDNHIINFGEVLTPEDLSFNKGITFLYWNIRSIFPKMQEIVHVLNSSECELIIAGESWLNDNISTNMIAVDGYNIFRLDRNPIWGKKRGGGLVAFAKDGLAISMVDNCCISTPDIELMSLRLDLKNVKEIYILGLYRPPDGNIELFLSELEKTIYNLTTRSNYEVNILGDFNLNVNKKRDPTVKKYLDFIKRNHLKNLIEFDTCYSTNMIAGTCIDHFLTSDPALYCQHGVCPIDVTDHYIIFGSRKKFKEKHVTFRMRARKYKNFDEVGFINTVENTNWDNVMDEANPSIAWDRFVFGFNSILNIFAPWRIMTFEKNLPVWITREFLSMCKERDNLKKTAKKTGNPEHRTIYNRRRNQVTSFSRTLKKTYFRHAFEEAGNDSKKMWKLVKQLFGTFKQKNIINEINGKNDNLAMAEEINQFFADIGPSLARDIPDSLLDMDFTFRGDYPVFDFSLTDEAAVGKLLDHMSSNKSTGIDGIPIRFLKMCRRTNVKILTHIINISLISKKVPHGWKKCCLTPLYKDGDRSVAGNYRPIAILPAASKLLERTVHQQVSKYFERHKLLSEAQFGFRKGFSTSTCILNLLNNIYKNMDNGMITGVLFLDLKKAFDTVDHRILLQKLSMYGISNEAVEWFKDYLSNREQSTKVNNCISTFKKTTCGVPQGSILGPLLFIIYVNDLGKYMTECSVNLYADDTAVYTASESYIDLILSLRIELGNLTQWLNANKLTLNVKKTKCLMIGSRTRLKNLQELDLSINGQKIEFVTEFKYLGLVLDNYLSFEPHIESILKKLAPKIGAIKKTRSCMDKKIALQLYKSIIGPHLDYCDTTYMTASQESLHKLQLLQNVCCRIILREDKTASIQDMHKELKLMPLDTRREFHLGQLCHKNIYHEGPASLSKFFIKKQTGRSTRQITNKQMVVPKHRTNMGAKAFSVRGPKFWNEITANVKSIEKFNPFSNAYKSHLSPEWDNHPT